jgi:hypothetical protein
MEHQEPLVELEHQVSREVPVILEEMDYLELLVCLVPLVYRAQQVPLVLQV